MARTIPSLAVVTTAYEDIPAATHALKDNDVYKMGSLEIRALYTPCHTRYVSLPPSWCKGKRGRCDGVDTPDLIMLHHTCNQGPCAVSCNLTREARYGTYTVFW